METKRLIPYSVHLPEHIYTALKEAAGNRKASALVRDAITLIINGDDEFNGGYNKAVTDIMSVISADDICSSISVNGQQISDHLCTMLADLVVPQNTKVKTRGKKKA